MEAKQAASFMRAFGDGTRLRILNALSHREMSVADLTRLLKCPKHRASRHLRYLLARAVVEWEAVGNAVVYRLALPRDHLHERVLSTVQKCFAMIEEVQRDNAQLTRGDKERSGRRGGRRRQL